MNRKEEDMKKEPPSGTREHSKVLGACEFQHIGQCHVLGGPATVCSASADRQGPAGLVAQPLRGTKFEKAGIELSEDVVDVGRVEGVQKTQTLYRRREDLQTVVGRFMLVHLNKKALMLEERAREGAGVVESPDGSEEAANDGGSVTVSVGGHLLGEEAHLGHTKARLLQIPLSRIQTSPLA